MRIQFYSLLCICAKGSTLASLCDEADSLLEIIHTAPRTLSVEFICDSSRRFSEIIASVLPQESYPDFDKTALLRLMKSRSWLQIYCVGALGELATLSQLAASATAAADTAIATIKPESFSWSDLTIYNIADKQLTDALNIMDKKYCTAELVANLQTALTVSHINNIRVSAAGCRPTSRDDPPQLCHGLERNVSRLADHLFVDQAAVTPATVAKMLEALPSLWVSAATFDLRRTAVEMAAQTSFPERFASLVPKLLSKRTNLRVSANAPRELKKIAEPVSTAMLLHHSGPSLPRIVVHSKTATGKCLAKLVDVLEAARRIRIDAQRVAAATCTGPESLAPLKKLLSMKSKQIAWDDRFLHESVLRVFAVDAKAFLGRVLRLLGQDVELISRLECPRSQPSVSPTV